MFVLLRPAILDEFIELLRFERDQGLDFLVRVDTGADSHDVVDPGHNGEPFGALPLYFRFVLPQGEFQLMGNMPKTALVQNCHFPFEPVQNGRVSVRHQEKALELLECLETLLEKPVPVPVVGADVDSRHPDRSAFHVLHQNLQFLAPFLDAFDADSRPVRLAPGFSLRIERERDLFPGFLHRPPDRHLVDRRSEGCHELFRHAKGRQGAQKPQLPSNLRRDPLVGIKTQQHAGDRELVPATRTLDLHLPKRHPGKGCQKLRRLATPRLPDEPFLVPTSPTRKRLLSSGHQKFSIADQGLLQKVSQNFRKKHRKCRQQGGQPNIRQGQSELTPKLDFEIFFLWDLSHNALSWIGECFG